MEEPEKEQESSDIAAIFVEQDTSLTDEQSALTSLFGSSLPDDKESTASDELSGSTADSGSNETKNDGVTEILKKHPLDDMPFEEVIKKVNAMQEEANHLNTENGMFERYLTINDPAAIEGMAATLENAIRMQGAETVRRATLAENYSFSSETKMGCPITPYAAMGGYRINLTQKSDMAMRELEELHKNLKKFYKDTHRQKCKLKAALEEINIEITEFTDAFNNFEQTVVTEGMDPLTQRIPAEKFERFMQEHLRTSTAVVQRYRLRQSTLSAHLKKLNETLKHKKEVGESLHAVDFEKLEIENNHFIKEIDARTSQLIDLKTMNGGANLILTNQKKFLMKQIAEIEEIQNNIDETKTKMEQMDVEIDKAEEQLDKVTAHYENIKGMTEEYKVPDVMVYVRLKSKLYDLRKNIKIWSRRSHLQNVALNSSIREMKNLTSSKKVLDSWFETTLPQSSSSSEFELTPMERMNAAKGGDSSDSQVSE